MTLAERFHQRFAGLDRAHGRYDLTGRVSESGKAQGRAETVRARVTAELWAKHLAGEQGLGIVPIRDDATVSFGAIDVDKNDIDHVALYNLVTRLNLPLVVCRSKSGGAHLYLFCRHPLPARLVRGKLLEWSTAIGHPGVEVFPKQVQLANENDVGNWINMPYFDHERTTRYAIVKGRAVDAQTFLDFAAGLEVDEENLANIVVPVPAGLEDGPPCLQLLSQSGFPEGTRNNGLFNLGVYAKRRYGDDWEGKLEDANRDFMTPPLTSSEVQQVIKSLKRKPSYFYTCNNPPISSVCNKAVCRTRKYGVGGDGDTTPPLLLGSIQKVLTDPPTYILDVEGVRIELTAEELLSQDRFRRACLERVNKVPPRLKQDRWDAILNQLLTTVEEVPAPPDAGPEGQFWTHVEAFCSDTSLARSQEELATGKPWVNAGRVYFRSPDLMRYLESQHFREFKERKVWATLRARGAKHETFNIRGKCIQCWSLPAFAQADRPYEIPRATPKQEDF